MNKNKNLITIKNDELRKRVPLVPMPHRFMTTGSVASLSEKQKFSLFSKVANFNDFNQDNDPHGEHDFGTIYQDGEKYFWKIDYYDDDYQFHKENGNRVILLMHARDY